jgi:protein O-mannosyl-transferase
VANHYQYLASLGIIALASAGAAMLLDRWGLWRRPGGYVVCLSLLAILAGLTWQHSEKYADVGTLYQTTIAENPDCWLAHDNLGISLCGHGRVDEAITHFEAALKIKPDHAEAHNNLGSALMRRGRIDEATSHFRKALELKPDYADARYNLGVAVYRQGKVPEAVADWRELIRLQPDYAAGYNQLAWVLASNPEASVRDGTRAVELAQRAVTLSGGRDPSYLDTLAAAYAEAGRFPEAVQTARSALELAAEQHKHSLAESIKARISRYKAGTPFRETP